jgi:hypothetical protein
LNPVTVTGKNAKRCTNRCNYYFHKECLAKWRNSSNQCPVCKEPIDEEQGGSAAGSAAGRADGILPEPAPETGGIARFPLFFFDEDESRAYWSELGYHWNDDEKQWENDQGRTPAQEDPVAYYFESGDVDLDQFTRAEVEPGLHNYNNEYWEAHGFDFDQHYNAWLFTHGELQGRLPSQVSAYWEYLDDTLHAFCCVNGCGELASFPFRLPEAYENGWIQIDDCMYCPEHAEMAIDMESE